MLVRRNATGRRVRADAVSGSVAPEAEQAIRLAAVEPVDRVVQPRMGVDAATARQRIVDVLGPVFFFEMCSRINCCIAAGTRKCLTTMSPRDNSRRIEFQHGLHAASIDPFRLWAAGLVFEFRGLAACERRGLDGQSGLRGYGQGFQEMVRECGTAGCEDHTGCRLEEVAGAGGGTSDAAPP